MSAAMMIGVDVGTSGTKAALVTPAGDVVHEAARETRLHRGADGSVEQDPAELLGSAQAVIGECGARADGAAVVAIGVSGQMAGILGVDAGGHPVTPYDSWLDHRCTPQLEAIEAACGETVFELTGAPPMIAHAPKMAWWRDEHPRLYASVARWLTPSAWVGLSLIGAPAARAWVDHTHLHFSGLADTRAAVWSDRLWRALRLDPGQLPGIVAPWAVMGGLSAAMADATGLPAGVSVVAGAGDTAAGALGAGIVAPGQLLDSAGSASVLLAAVDESRPDVDGGTLITMRGALPGQWLCLSYVAGGGLCLGHLAELCRQPGAGGPDFASVTTVLDGVDALDPGASGLLFVPHLDGRVLPPSPDLKGGWVGLGFEHRRPHLARAVLESIAFEYAGFLAAMTRLHPDTVWQTVRAVGGGARSPLWNGIKADVLGLPVERVGHDEVAALGAALLAGHGAGAIADLAAAASKVPAGEPHLPADERHALYERCRARYETAVDALERLTRQAAGALP